MTDRTMDRTAFVEFAEAVAAELGMRAETVDDGDGRPMDHLMRLHGEGYPEALTLRWDWRGTDRVWVNGDLPQAPPELRRQVTLPGSPEIGVSAARKPAHVANDIRRRLVPDWHDRVAQSRERIAAAVKRAEARANAVQALAAACPALQQIRHDRDSLGWYPTGDGYGDVTVQSGGSVSIELRSVPLATALAVAEVLARYEEDSRG